MFEDLWSQIGTLFIMKSGRDQLSRRKKLKGGYDEAMNQAFSEIFHNLKEIKQDIEKQRKKVYLERRRVSCPAITLKETRTTYQQSGNELKTKLSPVSAPSLPTMHWVLPCYDEDDEDIEPVDFNLGIFDSPRNNQFKKG